VVFPAEENIFISKTHKTTLGAVNFYGAIIVTHDRRIGPVINLTISASVEVGLSVFTYTRKNCF
jgi:hypothetical protein